MYCAIWYHLYNLKTWRSVAFSTKVTLLLNVTLFHGCFTRFLNCINGTKLRNASQLYCLYIFETCLSMRQGPSKSVINELPFITFQYFFLRSVFAETEVWWRLASISSLKLEVCISMLCQIVNDEKTRRKLELMNKFNVVVSFQNLENVYIFFFCKLSFFYNFYFVEFLYPLYRPFWGSLTALTKGNKL